jgi:hypothetical protein
VAKINVTGTDITVIRIEDTELICLSNMENLNAVFINERVPQKERLIKLNLIAIQQMKILQAVESRNQINY